jgi:hypothetical protein
MKHDNVRMASAAEKKHCILGRKMKSGRLGVPMPGEG